MIEFSKPLADARNYPAPTIFGLPSSQHLSESVPRVFPQGVSKHWHLDRGRSALYVLAKSISANKVWCPAYHCPALVEPFLAAGKQVNFYSITEELNPDFSQLEQELKAGDVVINIRYFGFDCGVQKLAEICQQKNTVLIEDLAHAMYTGKVYGKAAITSIVKFLPVKTGAELLVTDAFQNKSEVQNFIDNLPSVTFERVLSFFRKVKNKLGIKDPLSTFRYFSMRRISKNVVGSDKAVISAYSHQANKQKRRENYQYLAERLVESGLGEVVFPSLPDDIVPYVLPFKLNDAASFDDIRKQGLQIYRWEELAPTSCEVSQKFRDSLIQLPVHQSLTREDLNCIISIIKKAKRG
ncbi:hypothetical protein HII17_15955 [Thalassotalea sp. M1531]|uniref:DegT/DnrJ/EryC1/StrS aminotransferase family protein n=1 Tax=Thalassotalea algicola TaxID=2716224 RepID=A0A7Y0LF25_9GAMM|nr:DegT/DnrJ/EryC1/StrS family aminotransferase [Thalassotalea algicola]NMP33052.1 hypothetical protein [Thalassotalea algicola]